MIEHLIFNLKAGEALQKSLKSLSRSSAWHKLHISKPSPYIIPQSSIEYEISLLLQQGLKGIPILKSLEEINRTAHNKVDQLLELKTKKAPFLVLIPLFLLQLPSLGLIFFYPLIHSFLNGISV